MITAQQILDLQRRAPFQPFKFHMSDGRIVDVAHPEMMLVYRNSIVVANPGEDEVGQRFSILHITSLEGVEV
jgi:hypothetical protein